mgnify:CR=1 FL=1
MMKQAIVQLSKLRIHAAGYDNGKPKDKIEKNNW